MGSRYDDELWLLVPEDRVPPPRHLVEFVRGLRQAASALDLGCGDGRLTGELDAVAPLPLADGSFDLVLCAETIEHVRDVQLLLSEIRRVLRPAGALALTTPSSAPVGPPPDPLSPHLRHFTGRTLRRLVTDLGFEVESLRRRSGSLLLRATC